MPDLRRGLCDRCGHQQIVRTKRSTFTLCGLSRQDPRFPRYPKIPVLACRGFAPAGVDEERPG